MVRVTITLQGYERDALVLLAERERRDPRDQAAMLIRLALMQAELLPAEAQFQSADQQRKEGQDAERCGLAT